MNPVTPEELKSLAPYTDSQIRPAIERVLNHPAAPAIGRAYFPKLDWTSFQVEARAITSVFDFQRDFIDVLLKRLEKKTSTGITLTGRDQGPGPYPYLYLSNHRDIILDAALLTDLLFRHGYATPQICLGDNLLRDPLITDLVKMNKGITVKRDLSAKELFRWSRVLSHWIRQTITSGQDSVWIAQTEGRSKDGRDLTHPGVLKMLALSGDGTIIENLRSLHIVPVTVSYEYDPSDVEKSHEVYLSEVRGSYQKLPQEDAQSMARAFLDNKGGIFLAVGEEITAILDEAQGFESRADQVKFIVHTIDEKIHSQYHNWPTNYVACDELDQESKFRHLYTQDDREKFLARLEKRLDSNNLTGFERGETRKRVLALYAVTVRPQSPAD